MEYGEAVSEFLELLRTYPDFDYALAPIFWHISQLDDPTLEAFDGLLHSGKEADIHLLHHLIHESPKGLALSQPFFAMHVLGVAQTLDDEIGRSLRGALFTNALRGPGVRGYAGLTPPPPDLSHVSPAEALRDQWPVGSMMHAFYAELTQSHAPVLPLPSLHDDEGHEDDDISDVEPDRAPPPES